MPDPVFTPGWSPYAVFAGNPIWFNDPMGDVAGDYYKSDGTYLGSDGKDDNKVYVADGVTTLTKTDEKGNVGTETKFENAKDLGLGYNDFLDLSGTVYNEMTTGSKNWKEGAGIYSVLENRAALKGKRPWDMAKAGGIYGWGHRKEMINGRVNNRGKYEAPDPLKRQAALQGTIRGIWTIKTILAAVFFGRV